MSTKSRLTVVDAVQPTGEVLAMVSPFGGQPDIQGDVVADTAYDGDIQFWNASKDRLPVLISHDWEDESANIGYVENLEAVPGYGLVARMRLDMTNPRAVYIHKLMSERRQVEFSIGYMTLPGGEERQQDGSRLLTRIHLFEISTVLKGAAWDPTSRDGARTELLGVKVIRGPSGTILDPSMLDAPYTDLARFTPVDKLVHVEELSDGRGGDVMFCVVREVDNEVLSEHATREGAMVAMERELRAALPPGTGPDVSQRADAELQAIVARIDEVVGTRSAVATPLADALLQETKAEREAEAEERRRQAEWERDMQRRVDHLVHTTFADESADDYEDHLRFMQESERLAAERDQERAYEDAAAQARRDDARDDPRVYAP